MRHVYAGLILIMAAVMATPTLAGTVEFPVWSRTYSGTLGKKTVEVRLNRIADMISGDYCYAPCKEDTRHVLELKGRLKGQTAALGEANTAVSQNAKSGDWTLNFSGTAANGTWQSPDGKRSLPVGLTTASIFPYDMTLVADSLPDNDQSCPDVPVVHEIRLYKAGKLVQSLPTESQGTCEIFTPEVADMNFDGQPDLMIAQSLPAGPNISYDMWLYDAKTQHFVAAPASLTDVTSPEFDAFNKRVWHAWRGSCCDHGVDVYEWKAGELSQVDSGESYVLPVRSGGKDYYCYVMPEYADGRIEYPDAIYDNANGQLVAPTDLSGCDIGPNMLERTRVDVWHMSAAGIPVLIKTRGVAWQKIQIAGSARWCPVVPFVSNGRIAPAMLSDADVCSDSDPAAS